MTTYLTFYTVRQSFSPLLDSPSCQPTARLGRCHVYRTMYYGELLSPPLPLWLSSGDVQLRENVDEVRDD